MANCQVEITTTVPQYAKHYLLLKRDFSGSAFTDVIDDYAPEKEQEDIEAEFELGSPNNTNYANSYDEKKDAVYFGNLRSSSPFLVNGAELGKIGWKMYDYIEHALGLKEEGDYEPKFEENSSRDCIECAWRSSEEGVMKEFNSIFRGFRVCSLCSQKFCYSHCAYRRRLQTTAEKELQITNKRNSIDLDDNKNWMFVCKKCFEKGETQDLGQIKDHTSAFVKLRAKKNNVVEQRQDKILRNLENLSKKAPPPGDHPFSIWSLSNALPSAFQVGDNTTRKACTICEAQFSFWVKHQTCQLCSNLCCTSCCNFSVPLAKSPINPNGPKDRVGEILVCKECYHLINLKRNRIRFSQLCISERSASMTKQYEYTVALKKELDKELSEYMEKSEILDSSILDHFEMIPKSKKEKPTLVNFSDPVRSGSQKQLEKITPLFLEYQKSINKLLEVPAETKREKQVLENIKAAFQQQEGYVLLSQKIANCSKKE